MYRPEALHQTSAATLSTSPPSKVSASSTGLPLRQRVYAQPPPITIPRTTYTITYGTPTNLFSPDYLQNHTFTCPRCTTPNLAPLDFLSARPSDRNRGRPVQCCAKCRGVVVRRTKKGKYKIRARGTTLLEEMGRRVRDRIEDSAEDRPKLGMYVLAAVGGGVVGLIVMWLVSSSAAAASPSLEQELVGVDGSTMPVQSSTTVVSADCMGFDGVMQQCGTTLTMGDDGGWTKVGESGPTAVAMSEWE